MKLPLRSSPLAATRKLTLLTAAGLPRWLKAAPASVRKWVEGSGFAASPGEVLLIAGHDGKPARALAGLKGDGGAEDLWAAAGLSSKLPLGSYRLDPEPAGADATRVALGWALGAYSFTRYRKPGRAPAELVWPRDADRAATPRVCLTPFTLLMMRVATRR